MYEALLEKLNIIKKLNTEDSDLIIRLCNSYLKDRKSYSEMREKTSILNSNSITCLDSNIIDLDTIWVAPYFHTRMKYKISKIVDLISNTNIDDILNSPHKFLHKAIYLKPKREFFKPIDQIDIVDFIKNLDKEKKLNLNKEFKVKEKEKGIKGSIKSIFKPKYKTIKAVNNINFSVEEGEMLAFIGPNGAGKSTTIKMLTGILYPTSGEIKIMDLDPSKQRKQLAYKIGTVFGQKEQLWTHLTPYDNFKFFGAIYDMPENIIEKKIEELKNTFKLQEFINTPVRNLSLGQRIRCEIVAALIHEPEILFLDEPTIGLDPVIKENVRALIKKMNKEYKTTIFLTSHDIGDIEKLCKRVIIINYGKIILDSSMEKLKANKPLEDIITEIYKGTKEYN